MHDIDVNDEGTLVGFTPRTDAGIAFLTDTLESDGWQWLGNTLYVDHRFADNVIDIAIEHGLEVH